MTREEILSHVDHTLLKPEATWPQIQTTFHNTVPPLFCYLKLPQSPSVTAPSEREPCRQMQGNASLPEGGGCTAGADRGSYFFLKMISLLNT